MISVIQCDLYIHVKREMFMTSKLVQNRLTISKNPNFVPHGKKKKKKKKKGESDWRKKKKVNESLKKSLLTRIRRSCKLI